MFPIKCHWKQLDWSKIHSNLKSPELRIISHAINKNQMKVLTTSYERDFKHYPNYVYVIWDAECNAFLIYDTQPEVLKIDFRNYFELSQSVPCKIADTIEELEPVPIQPLNEQVSDSQPSKPHSSQHLRRLKSEFEDPVPIRNTLKVNTQAVTTYEAGKSKQGELKQAISLKESLALLIDIYTDLRSANVDPQLFRSLANRCANYGLVLIIDERVPFNSEQHISLGSVDSFHHAEHNLVAQIIRAGLMTNEGDVLVSAKVTRYRYIQ